MNEARTGFLENNIPLHNGWSLWPDICFRGTGFPVDTLDLLAEPELFTLIDEGLQAKQALHKQKDQLHLKLEQLKQASSKEDRKQFKTLQQSIKQEKNKHLTLPYPDDLERDLQTFFQNLEHFHLLEDKLRTEIKNQRKILRKKLKSQLANERFAEAIIWQNLHAWQTGAQAYLNAKEDRDNSKIRKHENLVINYIQRYAGKNESIGFFGPFAWGQFSPNLMTSELDIKSPFLKKRKLHFEYWAIASLAQRLSKQPELQDWLKPRLKDHCLIQDQTLYHREKSDLLSLEDAWVLKQCNGEKTVKVLTQAYVQEFPHQEKPEEKIKECLYHFAKKSYLDTCFRVPILPNPELHLRKDLESIADIDLKNKSLNTIDTFIRLKKQIEASSGHKHDLIKSISQLNETFQTFTHKTEQHHHGRVYSGRTLFYEDCLRNGSIRAGQDIIQKISKPLSCLFQSSHWLCSEIARLTDQRIITLCQEASSKSQAFRPLFNQLLKDKSIDLICQAVQKEHSRRWASILNIQDSNVPSFRLTQNIMEDVQQKFKAKHPSWPSARYHCPDISIAASSFEDIQTGQAQYILGEMHSGNNMITAPVYQNIHPNPEQIIFRYTQENDLFQIHPVLPTDYIGHRKVRDPGFARDFDLSTGLGTPSREADHVLRISELNVELQAGKPWVTCSRTLKRIPAILFFESFLRNASMQAYKIIETGTHHQRVQLDDLIIQRESWSFPTHQLSFAQTKDSLDQLYQLREWWTNHQLPRFVFYRVAQEFKPVYCDFESSASLRILFKHIRKSNELSQQKANLKLSEMIPAHQEAWLHNSQGQKYFSELRLVGVAPECWSYF